MTRPTLDTIVSFAKRRGFIYPGSEIYGGLAGTFDYGPHGVTLKQNIKQLWWTMCVTNREDMYGIDAAILMNPKAWVASGHVGGFSDPLVECNNCHQRFRADAIVDENDYQNFLSLYAQGMLDRLKAGDFQEKAAEVLKAVASRVSKDTAPGSTREEFIKQLMGDKTQEQRVEADIATNVFGEFEKAQKYTGHIAQAFLNTYVICSTKNCGKKDWKEPKQFNMMFKTDVGATGGDSISYLRPETAGGMFVNFKNVIDSFHPKLPFGLAQIGKAFRNEIAPRDFVFRTREFEQMEIEYFVHPDNWKKAFKEWQGIMRKFAGAIGIASESLHELEVSDVDRAHYSKRTIDFEFDYPFGRKELWGLAYRTDFDLKAHESASKVDLKYFDEEIKDKFTPHVIEPSLGVDRTILAVLLSAYAEDKLGGEVRQYLKLPVEIAPVRVAVFPLLKNKPELVAKARKVFTALKKKYGAVVFDDNGNIGKRYRRQDEIGTPFCVTIDFNTLGEDPSLLNTVTLRHRDTGEQERVPLTKLAAKLRR